MNYGKNRYINDVLGAAMKKKHILIEQAYKYNQPKLEKMNSICDYAIEKGYWIIRKTHEAMMTSDIGIKPMTKKEDRETGEDQKGE